MWPPVASRLTRNTPSPSLGLATCLQNPAPGSAGALGGSRPPTARVLWPWGHRGAWKGSLGGRTLLSPSLHTLPSGRALARVLTPPVQPSAGAPSCFSGGLLGALRRWGHLLPGSPAPLFSGCALARAPRLFTGLFLAKIYIQ